MTHLPSIFITKFHIPTNIESSNKNKGNERQGIPAFCSILRTRPIVVRLSSYSCTTIHAMVVQLYSYGRTTIEVIVVQL